MRAILRPSAGAPRLAAVTRGPTPPIRPQTDERLLAELEAKRPDDRSPRLLVPE